MHIVINSKEKTQESGYIHNPTIEQTLILKMKWLEFYGWK